MARPKKEPSIVYRKTIGVRLNEADLAKIDARRGAIPRGAYMRNAALGLPMPAPIPEPNRTAFAETARWASVLNQLARKTNAGDAVNMEELSEALREFRAGLLVLNEKK